ncbi:MAG: saccharopine dehydrogenase NADP-binding domain-containing protein [Thermoplasmata archaeon]|nr:saccharopine dehydrogenase NADP-binding domain-containing protein [Thermoplasmata archaeon]
MKKVVVFGAGLVAAPLVEYLLRQPDFQVTVATRTVSKAEKMVGNATNGKAMAFTIDQEEKLKELVKEHNIAVSLLPYTHHVKVARCCLRHGKHIVTTSYVSDAMKALDEEAKNAGIILLNECGLDPGIDHMSAMRIIHNVQAKGGKIASFTSFCGGLPAPEANTNPFGYKFSWSPRGVLLAGKNPAEFRMDGKDVHIESKDLFASYRMMDIEGLGEFEAYPNRDSLPYKEIYGIEDTDTILRGTLRYPGWCQTLKAIADIGYLSEEPMPELAGKTFKDLTAYLVGAGEGGHIQQKVADHLGLDRSAHQMERLEWLGLFSDIPLPREHDNSLDMLCSLMESKMQYQKNERDMIILQHNFIAKYKGRKEHIVSTLIAYGIPGGYTAMARTVGLPAAIATKMILQGEITEPGVHIPIKPGIYNPILDELEKEGIGFGEKTEAL